MTHETAEELAAGGLEWLLRTARDTDTGLGWPSVPSGDAVDSTLYQGTPGVVLALLEGHRHFADDRYGDAARRGAHHLVSTLDAITNAALYTGLTGVAVTLRETHRLLGDETSRAGAARALDLVRDRHNGDGWNNWYDLLLGNAGIGLAAIRLGDPDLAVLAMESFLRTAIPTPHGVGWRRKAEAEELYHHISHGTLGIAAALVAVGSAADRPDLVETGLAGVDDVLSRDESDHTGFLVPHSDPHRRPDLVERFSYGWCHGPTGDAQAFRLLAESTGEDHWRALVDRCWTTITGSGLPERRHPGFWDNNGRCCGTAGVLAAADDRTVEHGDGGEFAGVLVADLAERAVTDADGTRWSNHEHRIDDSELEPRIGWGHGNAGIVPELLRHARIGSGRSVDYAVELPDRPPARPLTG